MTNYTLKTPTAALTQSLPKYKLPNDKGEALLVGFSTDRDSLENVEKFLVQRTKDTWTPVTELSENVHREDMGEFGVWTDKSVAKHNLRSRLGIDYPEIASMPDGEIQENEVRVLHRDHPSSAKRANILAAELIASPDGGQPSLRQVFRGEDDNPVKHFLGMGESSESYQQSVLDDPECWIVRD